eukprot:TRINITY_DN5693_c0_g1_i1.p1 TRINITY_DN5693_c0_g1~~TRINITY_DN5693_c0_g1_i1.p1  ORF type:complete len:418 (+),score=121.20 TRINITY_DN5693_c0_g1_i1:102-1355(+)
MAPAVQWPPPAESNRRILFPTIPGLTNLGIGAPDEGTLRDLGSAVRKASAALHSDDADVTAMMQYGPVRGSGEYLDALSDFLSSEDGYGCAVAPERLFATAGATQGMHFVVTHFFRHGDIVFVEDPTYFLSIKILRSLGLSIETLPQASEGIGIDAEAFRRRCQQLPPAYGRPYRALMYVVPVYSNPTGRCWSESVMRDIVRVAAEQNVLVLSDDVYQMLRYTGPRPPRLVSYDTGKTVVSSSSFTKIFSPTMRVGWLEANPELVTELAQSPYAFSGGGFNHLQTRLMSSILRQGLQVEALRSMRSEYGRRVAAVSEVLSGGLPPGCTFSCPAGGYFVWIELPKGTDATGLLMRCIDSCGVAFATGASASPAPATKPTCAHCIRISFCYYDLDTVVGATERMCKFLRSAVNSAPSKL